VNTQLMSSGESCAQLELQSD